MDVGVHAVDGAEHGEDAAAPAHWPRGRDPQLGLVREPPREHGQVAPLEVGHEGHAAFAAHALSSEEYKTARAASRCRILRKWSIISPRRVSTKAGISAARSGGSKG